MHSVATAERAEVIGDVERLILATDMSRHADYIATLTTLLAAGDSSLVQPFSDLPPASGGRPAEEGMGELVTAETQRRRMLGELVIKCADTSNVFKPLPTARAWAVRRTLGILFPALSLHQATTATTT
jgi:hypothetical protein